MGWALGLIWPSIIIGLPGFCLVLPWAKEEKNPISSLFRLHPVHENLLAKMIVKGSFFIEFQCQAFTFFTSKEDGKQELSSCPLLTRIFVKTIILRDPYLYNIFNTWIIHWIYTTHKWMIKFYCSAFFFLFFLSSSYSSFSINTIMVSQREVHTDQAITFLQALLAKAFCLDKNKTNKWIRKLT